MGLGLTSIGRRILSATALCAALTAGTALAQPASMFALGRDDAAAYALAFHDTAQNQFDAAAHDVEAVADRSLIGYVDYLRLMAPTTVATYSELKAWLERYGDLPVADRVLRLARKRKPAGEPDPQPSVIDEMGDAIPVEPVDATGQAAREAYFSGDLATAYRLSAKSGEKWIAGLCAFRMKAYGEAADRFRAVATDADASEWLRAGAAYWSARALIADGRPDEAPELLALAARSPATFYGMLAERQLGLEPGADPQAYALAQAGFAPAPPRADVGFIKAAYTPASVDEQRVLQLLRTDARARRAAELMQVGRSGEAALELKAGIAAADGEDERAVWTTLAVDLGSSAAPQLKARESGFDPDAFPTPQLAPAGGFTLDKALVYAVVRQESRFDPFASSRVGAVGLMQVMPATAAQTARDDRLARDPMPLYDPGFNLRVGQDYLAELMQRLTDGDLIKVVAAYNGGPGAVLKAEAAAGQDDPLLLMESLPAAETRGYVEKVMAGYWIYRRMFGEPERTLDSLAAGARTIRIAQDR